MRSNIHRKERQLIGFFLFCPLLLLFTFGIYPMIALIEYSFTSLNGLSPTKNYVGLTNYIKILTDSSYLRVLFNSLVYFISGFIQIVIALFFAILLSGKVKGCNFFKATFVFPCLISGMAVAMLFRLFGFIQIVIALFFAILLSGKVKGCNFFKATFVFPCLISGMAVAMLFRLFLSPGGSFDRLLTLLGLEGSIRYWLGDPRVVNYTLGAISIWRHTGKSFILYFGAIKCIPVEHYKLAEIEGASWLQRIRYVILPGIHIVLKINFILLTIGAISTFELPMILTNGSNGTATFLLQTMKTAFDKKMFGLAASMAVIVSLVILMITTLQNKFYKGEEDD